MYFTPQLLAHLHDLCEDLVTHPTARWCDELPALQEAMRRLEVVDAFLAWLDQRIRLAAGANDEPTRLALALAEDDLINRIFSGRRA
jgi:hypothetical protein